LQSHVRTVGVVPADGAQHNHLERATPQRHHGQGTRTFLQRADETFHQGDAAALADGAETLADGLATTPLVQAMITELLARSVISCRGALPMRATTWPRK
jgi:hypothetical protein